MKIVNIGLVAHVDAGKTTLTEQLLLKAGVLRQAGAVDSGTTRTDTMAVERERGISVKAASVSLVHEGVRLNVIDTPGHVDFAAEVERALSVLDTAVVVISAVEGVQAQTELLYEALRATHTNVVFFINKIDRTGSNTAAVVEQIKEKFTPRLLPFNRVEREGDREAAVSPIPLTADSMQEAAAEGDEALLERYLSGESLSEKEVTAALATAIAGGEVCPLLFGSSLYGLGTAELLNLLTTFGQPIKNDREHPDTLSGVVYRITHDKAMGRVAHVRLFGGT
ncbi:MAG: GTP-binding protein, partial [Clostridia bacterium]|nr:GTP-binding protein [Clostridia bacterium]